MFLYDLILCFLKILLQSFLYLIALGTVSIQLESANDGNGDPGIDVVSNLLTFLVPKILKSATGSASALLTPQESQV